MSNGALTIDPIAVYIDTSSFSKFDQWLITSVLAPAALEMASKILGSIKLPSIPSYEGLTFKELKLQIINQQLIIFTALTSNPVDLSLVDFAPPDKNYYTLLSTTLINAAIQTQIPMLEAKFEPYKSGEVKAGDNFAWANGTYNVNLKELTASANTSNPTQFSISIQADINVSGSTGGIGPAMACPIGAALNAF